MKYLLLILIAISLPLTALGQNANSNINSNINANANKNVNSSVKINDTINLSFSQVTNFNLALGLSPESKLYFLKRWKEALGLLLTFNKEKKLEKMLTLSDKRLSEYGQMLDKGNIEKAQNVLADYQKQIDKAQNYATQIQKTVKDAKDISTKVSERINKHQQVLEKVYQKVPDSAKDEIKRVMEKYQEKIPNILERLTDPNVYTGAINKAKDVKNKVENNLVNESE